MFFNIVTRAKNNMADLHNFTRPRKMEGKQLKAPLCPERYWHWLTETKRIKQVNLLDDFDLVNWWFMDSIILVLVNKYFRSNCNIANRTSRMYMLLATNFYLCGLLIGITLNYLQIHMVTLTILRKRMIISDPHCNILENCICTLLFYSNGTIYSSPDHAYSLYFLAMVIYISLQFSSDNLMQITLSLQLSKPGSSSSSWFHLHHEDFWKSIPAEWPYPQWPVTISCYFV